jgi:hypothetical protein
MKTYWEMDIWFQVFLTSALDESKLLLSRLGPPCPRRKTPSIVTIEFPNGWATVPVWTLWRAAESVAPTANRIVITRLSSQPLYRLRYTSSNDRYI